MTDFDQKLTEMNSDKIPNLNPDEFLTKLHGRIHASHQNQQTGFAGLMMLLVVGFLSYTQWGVPIETELYYADETEVIFETDFWTIDVDYLEIDESYTEDLAYFLLDEGDFWDTIDLLNELTNEEEITL